MNHFFLCHDLERDLLLFHEFHNIPLSYSKGLPMVIRDKHLQAIARAKHFIRSGIVPTMSPKHIEQVENDLFLLDQVHSYLRVAMNEPCLPMVSDLSAPFLDGAKDGNTSTPPTV